MKIDLESNPGVVSITIVTESKEGNPLVLRFARWSKEENPHLYCFSEHFLGVETECQYRPEGWCYVCDVGVRISEMMRIVRDAQSILNLSAYQIAVQLLRKHSDESFFPISLFQAFQDFRTMEIPEEES